MKGIIKSVMLLIAILFSTIICACKDNDENSTVKYDVTVKVSNDDYGTVTGNGNYESGSLAILNAVSKDDAVFNGWYKNDTLVCSEKQYIFYVVDNTDLTA